MSSQLKDQQVLQIVQHLYKAMQSEQNQKLLEPQHLDTFKRRQIKPMYPHKYITENNVRKPQKYSCSEICCQLSSGSTTCGCFCQIKAPDSIYQQFGLGANIYFNFMKHFSSCFIFLALLSVVSVGICYYISMSNEINPVSNYQLFFFSTTMGAFSSSYFNCKYSSLKTHGGLPTGPYYATFNISCPSGDIVQFAPVLTANSEESLTNCKVQRQKYQTKNAFYSIPTSDYLINRDSSCNSKSCFLNVSFTNKPSTQIISYPYECTNPTYLFFDKFDIDIRVLTYVVVGIDLFITLGFLFFLCSEKEGQDKQIDHFKNFQLSLKDFSIKVKGFSTATFDQQFQQLISTVKKQSHDFDQKIIQIKTPDDQEYLEMNQKRKEKYQELFKFMQRNFFDSFINPNNYHSAQHFIVNIFDDENYTSFKRELEQLLEEYKKSRHSTQKYDREISLYLVLNSSSDISKLKVARTKSCFGKYIVTNNGKKYSLQDAPIPDMLQWQNKGKLTCLRVIISWIFTLSVVVASYILFGYVQWQQKRLLQGYDFKIDCKLYYSSTNDLQVFNSTLSAANSAQYTHCYCSNHYFSLNVSSQDSAICEGWRKSYVLYLIIPIFISMGLVVYNLVVSIIFKKITQFQGHFFVTDEMFSYVVKRSFILIMNMGLIIVLLNFSYPGDLNYEGLKFLFQGQFNDLTSDWYISIGSIVIMTMIFNIFFPFMELIMTSIFKCFRKCFDKRCWTRKTSKKYKADYISLYSGDVYPIEQRYALIISIFWITLIFNCVIPLLNIIAALSFFLLQIVDKLLVFKFFKTPPNFDESLHRKFIRTLYIGIILHMASTAFLLSEPNLVPNNSSFPSPGILNSSNARVNKLIQTYYIIPYVCLFIILVLYGLLKSTIAGLLQGCKKKIQRSSAYKIRNSQNFYQSLNQHQLYRLKIMAERQINRLHTLKRGKIDYNMRTDHSQMCINPNKREKDSPQSTNTQIDIYRRTHENIIRCLQLHKNNQVHIKAKLIGLPGYDMTVNEVQSQKQKKMLQLDSVMEKVIGLKR